MMLLAGRWIPFSGMILSFLFFILYVAWFMAQHWCVITADSALSGLMQFILLSTGYWIAE
jgi:hypothetical protein